MCFYIGAGDCFTAAFVVGLLEGMEEPKAMKFASKDSRSMKNRIHVITGSAAAQCIQKKGAMSSLPLREQVNFGFP